MSIDFDPRIQRPNDDHGVVATGDEVNSIDPIDPALTKSSTLSRFKTGTRQIGTMRPGLSQDRRSVEAQYGGIPAIIACPDRPWQSV